MFYCACVKTRVKLPEGSCLDPPAYHAVQFVDKMLSKHTLVSLKMRQLFMVTFPSLVVLGVLSLSGLYWWRNRAKKSTRRTSVESTTSIPSVQPSPSISEDSGVVDGAQVSEKNSEESLAPVVASQPSRGNNESGSKSRWKYPTASSDVDCESMSEVGSMCSSEEVFSESPNYVPGTNKRKKIGASQSAPSVLVESDVQSEMQKSVSTPNINAISWPNRKRVMVSHNKLLYSKYFCIIIIFVSILKMFLYIAGTVTPRSGGSVHWEARS